MATYRRRGTATIEATQFTSELGAAAPVGESADEGLVRSQQGGYYFYGQRIAFGDYMVGRDVVTREAFEADYEAVPEAPPVVAAPARRSTRTEAPASE